MIELNAITIIGLVGVTLVVATGKVFDGARAWLVGFTHPLNPLRWIGEGMSCTMCAGWWIGFWWGVYSGSGVVSAVVVGGVVSAASFLGDEVLAIVAAVGIRLVRRAAPAPTQVPIRTIHPQRAPEDPDLSEEDAHHIADDEEHRSDDVA